jgi:hypothetical protein
LATGFRLTYSTFNCNATRNRIAPLDLRSHMFELRRTIKHLHADGQRFRLPA